MKINWGTGIAIFYTLFVIAMVSMVVKSTYHKAHLVQEDYFNKDLNYEEFRKKRQNATSVNISVDVKEQAKGQTLLLQFPSSMNNAQGHVVLFRPSNKNLDQKIPLRLNANGAMEFPMKSRLLEGLWKVQLEWESDQVEYYKEEQIII